MRNSQICANSCPKAVGGQPCAHCPLITAQRDAEREDEAWEVQQTLNACRSTRIIKQLEQSIKDGKELTDSMLDRSANRADILVFCWFAVGILIALMAVLGSGS